MSYKIKGVVPPMVTPFDKNGNVDEKELIKLVQFLDEKVHGVFICGSYGSGPLMSIEERKFVAEVVKREAKKLQIVVMTGAANTNDTVELSIHAKEIGCDAVSAVTPYYYHHNMEDVISFYQEMIDAVGKDFPVYIYTNPKFSGYEVDVTTMEKLKEIGVHGVKAASFDIMEFATYKRIFEGTNFDVVLGTEALWLPASIYGGEGFIPGLANAFPEICVKMYNESLEHNYEECRRTQYKINELRDVMYLAKSTQLAIYAMLEIRGVIKSYPRKPFQPATEEEIGNIKKKIIELGMLT